MHPGRKVRLHSKQEVALKHPTYDDLFHLPEAFPGMGMLTREQTYLMGCGNFEQFCATLRGLIDPKCHCPFCQVAAGQETPLFATKNWYLRGNDFPKPDLQMFLVIPKEHKLHPDEIGPDEGSQIWKILQWAISNYKLPGGGLVMRFGDPAYHAGTIPHLHMNIITPSREDEYRVPLSKNRDDRIKNYARFLANRQQLYLFGGLDYLFKTT